MRSHDSRGQLDGAGIATPDLLLLVLINLIWGFNLVAAKYGVSEIPPILFTALRFMVLGILLLPLLRVFHGQMGLLLTFASLSGALHFGLMFYGLSLADDVSAVAIATQLGVPFSTLLSVWLLGEQIRWRRKLGIALAFGGIVIIAFDPRAFAYWPGLLLVIAACFVGSLGLIYVKRLVGIRALQLQAWVATTSWPLLLLLSFLVESEQGAALEQASWLAWAAVLFTALAASLVAHSGMYYLITRYPVTSVSPLTLLTPVFGIIFGVTLLDDQVSSRMLLGGAVTLVGVYIVAARGRRLADTAT